MVVVVVVVDDDLTLSYLLLKGKEDDK